MKDEDEPAASGSSDGVAAAAFPSPPVRPAGPTPRDVWLLLGRMRHEVFVGLGLVSAVVFCATLAREGGLRDHAATHAFLLLAACLAIAYDWRAVGPTVALQQGPVAAAVAWLLAVFGGPLVTRTVFQSLIFMMFSLLAFIVILAVVVSGGALLIPSVVVGIVAVVLWYVRTVMADALGVAAVFLGTYWMLKSAMLVERVEKWPRVTMVEPQSEEYNAQLAAFQNACTVWGHMYPFQLTVRNIYKVRRRLRAETLANTKHLYHGTEWHSAKGIVCDGFRLPMRPGMFGTGIYFADCPLKSWRYCFPSFGVSTMLPRIKQRGGLILMCEVALGEVRPEAQANRGHRGFDRRSLRSWLQCWPCRYVEVLMCWKPPIFEVSKA
ncbi:unnamed protein product [Prorocentrum cordatum]|uniref:Poly [ADP-ribose] polymerase n=1 Tax=Prorocentrum cordatum TaxID=2364126 RepID=A0ABN9TAR1_9DINO|nr:unnamed protein product [Polarella glacialis]